MAVAIKNLTRHASSVAGVPFTKAAAEVLPGWDISLVFVGPTKAQALNLKLRGKDYIPNVLSYVVGEKSGEIIICPSEAAKQAPAYSLPPASYNLYLFIHGLLHIKGWAHGATMEVCEQKLLAKLAKGVTRSLPNVTTHRNRDRHRHLSGEDGRRRRSRP